MTTRKISMLMLMIIAVFQIKAQEKVLLNADEAKALSMKVTELFKDNKIPAAVDELKIYWPLPENEIDILKEKSVKYLNMAGERYGKAEGIIKISEETIKDIAIKETYFVRYQYSAFRLIFVYYKNKNGWVINSFKWDDNFAQEFK